jgi:hypothetical protein
MPEDNSSYPKTKLFYFTRHDEDLQKAIFETSKGDQSHEIRKALRFWFLAEVPAKGFPERISEVLLNNLEENNHQNSEVTNEVDEVISSLQLPAHDFIRY